MGTGICLFSSRKMRFALLGLRCLKMGVEKINKMGTRIYKS